MTAAGASGSGDGDDAPGTGRLDADDARSLHHVAWTAIAAYVTGGRVPDFDIPSGPLRRRQGAYVVLYKDGRLRGCIGRVDPAGPVWRTVRECAVGAAARDPRYPPVVASELADLSVQVVLPGPLRRTSDPLREVAPKTDGVLVKRRGLKAVLLPDAAVHHGWSVRETLDQACLKAGLEAEAWRADGDDAAEVWRFPTEIIGGRGRPEGPPGADDD